MGKLVGVGQMATIPCYQKFTFVMRCDRQMKCVTDRILWHNMMHDVGIHDFRDFFFDVEQRDRFQQLQSIVFLWKAPLFQFVDHRFAGEEFVIQAMIIPPFARPVTPGHHLRFGSNLEIETRDRCFDVNACLHNDNSIVNP